MAFYCISDDKHSATALARHSNHPSLWCRCIPGAQLAISVTRNWLSKKARERAKGEKRLSGQSLAFPARGTKIVSGPGSGSRSDHNPIPGPFLSVGSLSHSRELRNVRVKKKRKKEMGVYSCIELSKRYNNVIILIIII